MNSESGKHPAHSTKGLYRILGTPVVYEFLQDLLGAKRARERYVRDYVRPFSGCRILDIGCGPGAILNALPRDIEYVGFDFNPKYINQAEKIYGSRARFFCGSVESYFTSENDEQRFDIALATGVLHHLSDREASKLFEQSFKALRPGGVLVTFDNVYVPNQSKIARWIISMDRGKNVRNPEGYLDLAKGQFPKVEAQIISDMLRIPYTHFIMRCEKQG